MAHPTNMSLKGICDWATGSGSSNGINANTANTANTATTATTASKLGTSTIGSQYEPIYLNAGVPTKCAGGAGGGVPVGTIISYGGLRTPTGFMLCNGAYLNRTDYAELYSAIGTTFGSSSGTDFRLPLLNDNRFLVRYFIKYTGAVQSGSITIQKTFTGTLPPTGTVIAWAGTSNVWPEGFLRCDGAAYSRTTYSALYAVIGTTYGYTSSSTFKVPNLQSKFIQGAEGNTVRSDIPAGLPNIKGTFKSFDRAYNDYITGAFAYDSRWNSNIKSGSDDTWGTNVSLDASRSSSIYGNSTTVQPPAVAMQYIIKY